MTQPMNSTILPATSPAALDKAVEVLRNGGLVCFPTDTVYGVGVDGLQPKAVARIYDVKGRMAQKAIPLLLARAADMETVAQDVSPSTWKLAERFWPGGLTLVLRRRPLVPDIVTSGGPTVAVRVPNHPVPLKLIQMLGHPLATTSANRSGQPSSVTTSEIVKSLGGLVEIILDGGRSPGGVESTVLDLSSEEPVLLRQGAIAVEELAGVLGRSIRTA